MNNQDEFTTLYFEPGFESLVNLAERIETKCAVDTGIGSDFINVYTEDTVAMTIVFKVVRDWTKQYPHVRLSSVEHGDV